MIQYSSLNVNLSNSQLNRLKSAVKSETEVVLWLSSNMIGNSSDSSVKQSDPAHFLKGSR